MTSQGHAALDGEFEKQTQVCLTLTKFFSHQECKFSGQQLNDSLLNECCGINEHTDVYTVGTTTIHFSCALTHTHFSSLSLFQLVILSKHV